MSQLETPINGAQETVAGKWNQIKGTVKEQLGQLTNDKNTEVAGKHEQFLGLLQEKYGYTLEQAREAFDDVVANYKNAKQRVKNIKESKEETNQQENDQSSSSKRKWFVMAIIAGLVYYFKRSK